MDLLVTLLVALGPICAPIGKAPEMEPGEHYFPEYRMSITVTESHDVVVCRFPADSTVKK